jgi:hypothetical protein
MVKLMNNALHTLGSSRKETITMAESPRVTIRIPAKLKAALVKKAKAAGIDLGSYIRQLCEQDTGISIEIERGGFDKMSTRKQKQASRKGLNSRWKDT